MTAQLGRKQTEKVCLFIDNNALSAALSGCKLNFQKLREWLVAHREVSIARVYCGELQNDDRFTFYQYLKRLGFDVVVCRNSRSRSRSASYDSDLSRAISCEIAWDVCQALSTGWYNSVIIVSGGFEMAEIASRIRERGTEVEVAFPANSCSPTLRGRATVFRPITTDIFTSDKLSIQEKVLQ
jgi:hypothetical protein